MKTKEIEVGKRYTDGKGNVREVIAAGPDYVLYSGQGDRDCVRYRQVAKVSGPNLLNSEHNTTRNSFASWAKSAVPEEGTAHE